MDIKSFIEIIDFKLMCEAKDRVLGSREFEPIWENIKEIFELYNRKCVTIERLQEVVKGNILFALNTEHLIFENQFLKNKLKNIESLIDNDRTASEIREELNKNI